MSKVQPFGNRQGATEAVVGAVRIVPMRRRHLPGVTRIEGLTRPRGWSANLFLSELAQKETRLYAVVLQGSVVAGFGGLMFIEDDAHITTISVDPAVHRQALGTRLLHVLAEQAIRRGARNLTLEVRVTNTAAQELYRRFGFVPGGIRKGYYADIGEDALVMWAMDIDSPDYGRRLGLIARALPSPTTVEGFER